MSSTVSTIRLVWLLAVFSNLFFYCSELPLIRLAEQKICRQYFEHSPSLADDLHRDCSVSDIQDQVAHFIGLRTAFDAVPPLLVSLWYGSSLSPKTIITLACTGELFNLAWVILIARGTFFQDIRLAWIAALFLLIGGGQFLLYAMFSLIIVDVTPPRDRTKYLATLHSITLSSSLVGAPLSGLLLQVSLDLTFSCVILLALIRYPIIWALRDLGERIRESAAENLVTTPNETDALIATNTALNSPPAAGIWSQMITFVSVPAVSFAFLCFLLKRVAFTSEVLMYQTVAERLNESLNETAWLRIPIGLGAVLTLWILLPVSLRQLKQLLDHGLLAETWAVRANLTVLLLGFGLFWFSSDYLGIVLALILCGLGEGLAPTLQTLVSSITDKRKHGSLFAAISVIDTVAKLIGGPVMAWTFSIRDSHNRSNGYCFLLSSVLFSIMLCLSFTVPLPDI